ncbi:hypothetical protein RGQ29_003513 [Quercus rubra]|uniref:Uncharacterized protein n=1 Tax=Quercus rubra TaxID=3512 RepID=A0AAN7EDI2_QUERU|nr:hypothetical protein RGQ29_003513 [Quercus rubra]
MKLRPTYRITREIESEIVKCSEIETALALRESELTKRLYVSHFEINGFAIVTANSRASLNCLEKELCCARMKRDEMLRRINDKREGFTTLCREFQRDIDIGKNDELRALLSEKDLHENEIHLLDKKNNALKNSMLAFVEEILEDLHKSNSGGFYSNILNLALNNVTIEFKLGARFLPIGHRLEIASTLQVEIQTGNQENEKSLKDIDDLQKLLLSTVMADDDHWFTITNRFTMPMRIRDCHLKGQVIVPDAQYEYFTHVEDDDDDDDDDYVDETTIYDEDFVDRDEYEERIE